MTISPDELPLNEYMTERAKTYGFERPHRVVANRWRSELLRRYSDSDSLALDVGCANGLYAIQAAPHYRHVTGVDLNDEVLQSGRDRLAELEISNVELRQENAKALPFGDNSFDMAYSFAVLSVVPEDRPILQEIARVVRPGGRVVLDMAGSQHPSSEYFKALWADQGVPYNAYRYQELRQLLGQVGLVPERVYGFGVMEIWRSLPVISRLQGLDAVIHASAQLYDLDFAVSNLPWIKSFAPRWYFVCRAK
ncbi:hypothetical protein Lfu02_75060 [Longispora fulva]|uniref:SAM-dependent methyltransferase n=1 Tax=Longispora fulva TaxID=619741 RepID=A0A8J7GD47_9ACTN|nr:class I SAM-dependent methyltransferase [Longispora fulva]MBG6134242.1 SAM-dependent methyltransferase [Longispora fulva]GIG63134.1 hypothetical protein Lfu02_75060 [Longispora fulva]